jgi:hypothetical protein
VVLNGDAHRGEVLLLPVLLHAIDDDVRAR